MEFNPAPVGYNLLWPSAGLRVNCRGMLRRLFKLIFQLVALALVIFLLTAVWIVFDGLTDLGEKTDVGVVLGRSEHGQGASDPLAEARLDRAIKLYDDSQFPIIVVVGSGGGGAYDQPGAMASYLEDHGISSSVIIEARAGIDTLDTARQLAEIMKQRGFVSVMIVTDYYHVTRTKLALRHEGVSEIKQTHVGFLRKEDAAKIGREVVALYDYIGKLYLLPGAKKVEAEAEVGLEKAKVDAESAKKTVDQRIDSMAK